MAIGQGHERRRGRLEGGASSAVAVHEINWKNLKDSELVSFIDSQVEVHKLQHYAWVRRAKTQLAWAQGDQLSVWGELEGGLVDSYDVQSDRIAIFVNRIRPAVLNWISMIMARPLTFRVNPATTDHDDVASASVQDKLVQYYFRKLFHDDKFIDMLWMMFCTGCVFVKSTWDPYAGQEFDVSPQELLPDDELAEANGNTTGIRNRFRNMLGNLMGTDPEGVALNVDDSFGVAEGDLECDYLTGFDIIPPVRATNVQDSPWLITKQHTMIEDIRLRYGKKADKISGGQYDPYDASYDYSSLNYRNNSLGLDRDHAILYELWRPVSRAVPKGVHVVYCQGEILHKGKNPYNHGQIPVVMLQELPSPKQFWPSSTVEDLMSIQEEMNITTSQIAEHKASTIEPKIIAEKGIGLDELAFTQRNEINFVNPGKIDKVKPWVPEPLPAYMSFWEQKLRRDFDDVSRNHASSYGKQTGSARSGKQVIALQEADARMNAPMMRTMRDRLGRVCSQWLSLLKQYGEEERVITIIGQNSTPEVLKWSKHDFPEADFNVECDLGPSIDRQTTMEMVDMLTARGWIHPDNPTDKQTVFRWLGEGVAKEIDAGSQDRRNAAMENEHILAGNIVEVSDGDDDSTHLYEHAREQKSGRFKEALSRDPTLERRFEVHKISHERQRITKQVRQKVAAMEIEMRLMQEHGLMPPPGDAPRTGPSSGVPASGGGSGSKQKKTGKQEMPDNQGTFVGKQSKNKVRGSRTDRPQKTSRVAPGNY